MHRRVPTGKVTRQRSQRTSNGAGALASTSRMVSNRRSGPASVASGAGRDRVKRERPPVDVGSAPMRNRDASPPDTRNAARGAARAAYKVELLRDPSLTARGVLHRAPDGERLLRWEEVLFALAAEVGEPEGVRAIVFDLVLGCDAQGWRVARLDADPGPSAVAIAHAIHEGVGPPQRGPSIKALAIDGVASWWHADLESFEEAAAAAIPAWIR